jgi:hypothetical protein
MMPSETRLQRERRFEEKLKSDPVLAERWASMPACPLRSRAQPPAQVIPLPGTQFLPDAYRRQATKVDLSKLTCTELSIEVNDRMNEVFRREREDQSILAAPGVEEWHRINKENNATFEQMAQQARKAARQAAALRLIAKFKANGGVK